MRNAELSYQGDNLKIKKAVFNKLKEKLFTSNE